MSGVIMSWTSAWTIALNATPMTTATARSRMLPRIRNFLKPLMSDLHAASVRSSSSSGSRDATKSGPGTALTGDKLTPTVTRLTLPPRPIDVIGGRRCRPVSSGRISGL